MKMQALQSFETLGIIHPTVHHYILDDLNPQQHCCENLKSQFNEFPDYYHVQKLMHDLTSDINLTQQTTTEK